MSVNQAEARYQGLIYFSWGSVQIGGLIWITGVVDIFGLSGEFNAFLGAFGRIAAGVLMTTLLFGCIFCIIKGSRLYGPVKILSLNDIADEYLEQVNAKAIILAYLVAVSSLTLLMLAERGGLLVDGPNLLQCLKIVLGGSLLAAGSYTIMAIYGEDDSY